MVDKEGFRPNVGIVISDGAGKLFWGKRVGQSGWQFPQGGISRGEKPEDALYRELFEEVGLESQDVKIIGSTKGWLRYRLPKKFVRKNSSPLCIGQKQKWFLLTLISDESRIAFDRVDTPEFDNYSWVNYWYPVAQVVDFKQDVYRRALRELSPLHSNIERQL
ncbi:MAG: RNA pyrophosphohydrolase [Porticoccaceae bacterium]|nr:RNA pyrophosphohydrolase [Pseudomonadales bacterium]